MNAKIVKRSYDYVRLDLVSIVVYPIVIVGIVIIAGKALIALGVVKSFYASPFVVAAALVANRVCIRAGMIAAAMSVLAHEFFFAAPYNQLNIPTVEQAVAYAMNFIVAYAVARRTPKVPARRAVNPDAQPLPFTSKTDGSERTFWAVQSSQDWIEDCHLGSEYGRIYVDRLIADGGVPPLGWVIRDMIKSGSYTGVEAGFATAVSLAVTGKSIELEVLLPRVDNDPDQAKTC